MADPQGDPRDEYERQQGRPAGAARPTMTLEAEYEDDPQMRAAMSLGELVAKQGDLTITQERSLFGEIVIAQPIRVPRNEAEILKKVEISGAGAGARWFYRYPVKNRRKGTTEYIEGPTVKCTDAVLMRYKNAAVESRTLPMPGGDYICYSRFCDWENGVSITMGQLVPKSATLGGEDAERRLQIAHNVGQSKSRRNVCVAAMGEFVQRGFLSAKRSLVERIGRDINKSRGVIVEELAKLGIANIVQRVEHTYARKHTEWTPGDIASIYAELQAIEDGFSSTDETWPLPAPPEPRRNETPAAAAAPSAGSSPAEATVSGAAASASSAPPATGGGEPPPVTTTEQPRDWTIPPNTMGQDNVIKALGELLDETTSDAEQDQLERQNAERIGKITGIKGTELKKRFADKRLSRAQGGKP